MNRREEENSSKSCENLQVQYQIEEHESVRRKAEGSLRKIEKWERNEESAIVVDLA